jgi:nucleoside-diphosphate-sugar epimerase
MHKILITGNNGFIGSYLQKHLGRRYGTVGISRATGHDITDLASLMKIEGSVDTIIHTAAVASNDFEDAFRINALGTLNLCRFAKEKGIKRLILLSSIFALEHEENGYFNSYGRTKKFSEEIARAYCEENGISLSILRLSQVYDDARLAQTGQAMLYYFIDTIRNEGKITLFGKRNPLRNYIHIDYLSHVVEDVVAHQDSGIWNVTETRDHTITEIAYMIFETLQKTPSLTYLEEKPDIPSVHIPKEAIYRNENIISIPLRDGIERIINHDG